jgi:hypothetical protein
VRQSAARYLQFAEEIIRRAAVSSRQAAAVGHSLAFKEAPTIKLDEGEALRYVAGFFADDPNATSYLQALLRLSNWCRSDNRNSACWN